MRKMMICVSVMLALVQLWPMVFGHQMMPTAPAIAAQAVALVSPGRVGQAIPAVAKHADKNALPATGAANPIGCYQRYQRAYSACSPDSSGCRMQAADHWDLCEATGFWPE